MRAPAIRRLHRAWKPNAARQEAPLRPTCAQRLVRKAGFQPALRGLAHSPVGVVHDLCARSLSQVDFAILEATGEMSVFLNQRPPSDQGLLDKAIAHDQGKSA